MWGGDQYISHFIIYFVVYALQHFQKILREITPDFWKAE